MDKFAFFCTLALIFVFWPWAVGFCDLGFWAATGQQLTAIPWKSARGGVMIFWPILWCLIVTLVSPGF